MQALVLPGFEPSAWDRPNQRAHAFPGQQLASRMVRQNAGSNYFASANRYLPVLLMYYSRDRCLLEGWNANDNMRVLASLEMIAPNLPAACFLPANESRKVLIRSLLGGLQYYGYESVFSRGLEGVNPVSTVAAVNTIVQRFPANIPEELDDFIRALASLGPEPAIVDGTYTANMAEAVIFFVDYLASRHTPKGRSVGCNLYTLMYVSLGKRGTITQSKMLSITRAISEETNLSCDVEPDEVRICGSLMAPFITETNAQAIMEGLALNMEAYSLRLRSTVMQTTKAGMTCFWAIYEAIRIFNQFPWDEASRFILEDFINYGAAYAEVNGNLYYGFRKDLGVARHTKYKSLSWLSVKLLIQHKGGEYGSLTNYRGLTLHPDREQDLLMPMSHQQTLKHGMEYPICLISSDRCNTEMLLICPILADGLVHNIRY